MHAYLKHAVVFFFENVLQSNGNRRVTLILDPLCSVHSRVQRVLILTTRGIIGVRNVSYKQLPFFYKQEKKYLPIV